MISIEIESGTLRVLEFSFQAMAIGSGTLREEFSWRATGIESGMLRGKFSCRAKASASGTLHWRLPLPR
jgi:hypothetical protein